MRTKRMENDFNALRERVRSWRTQLAPKVRPKKDTLRKPLGISIMIINMG